MNKITTVIKFIFIIFCHLISPLGISISCLMALTMLSFIKQKASLFDRSVTLMRTYSYHKLKSVDYIYLFIYALIKTVNKVETS